MNLLRDDVQNTLSSSGALAASLLSQETHRSALVQETELSSGVLGVTWVSIDATIKEGAMEITNKGTNVTRSVRLATPVRGLLEGVHVRLEFRGPSLVVTLIERVDHALLMDLDVRVREDELTD